MFCLYFDSHSKTIEHNANIFPDCFIMFIADKLFIEYDIYITTLDNKTEKDLL